MSRDLTHRASCARGARTGISLLEVLAAMSLVGLMAIAAAKPMRMAAVGVAGAKTSASRLAVDLMRCRRLALKSSEPHDLAFRYSDGEVVGYQLSRGGRPIGQPTLLPKHVRLVAERGGRRVEFDSLGQASGSAQLDLMQGNTASPILMWRVVVAQATGAVSVTRVEN